MIPSRDYLKTIRPVDAMFKLGEAILKKEFEHVETEYAFMDLFGCNHNGDSCEIEIKCGDYDLYKELVKPSKVAKHTNYLAGVGFVPTRFYFLVLQPVERKAIAWMDKHSLPYGLLVFNSNNGHGYMARKSQKLSDLPFLGEVNYYKDHFDFGHKRSVI